MDQFNYMKDVVSKIKNDVDKNSDSMKVFKKDLSTSIGKVHEMYDLKQAITSLKQEVVSLNNKVNSSLQNMQNDINRINIKVDDTSKLLKDLDKVL